MNEFGRSPKRTRYPSRYSRKKSRSRKLKSWMALHTLCAP